MEVYVDAPDFYVRKIQQEDTDTIVMFRNSDAVRPYFIDQEPLTPKLHMWWLKEHVSTGKALQGIIVMKDTKCPIGTVYMKQLDTKNPEFGYYIGKEEMKGKAYATRAGKGLITYAQKAGMLEGKHMIARAFEDNIRSVRGLESLGFIHTYTTLVQNRKLCFFEYDVKDMKIGEYE